MPKPMSPRLIGIEHAGASQPQSIWQKEMAKNHVSTEIKVLVYYSGPYTRHHSHCFTIGEALLKQARLKC